MQHLLDRARWVKKTHEKSLSRRLRHQSQKQPTLFKPRCLLISRSWFPSVLPKSGDFSFISSANSLSRLPTTWPGHSGDAPIKLSLGPAITSAEALSPVIYNCRNKRLSQKSRGEKRADAGVSSPVGPTCGPDSSRPYSCVFARPTKRRRSCAIVLEWPRLIAGLWPSRRGQAYEPDRLPGPLRWHASA